MTSPSDLDASRVGLLAALVAEAWPEIVKVYEDIPEPARRVIQDFYNAGTTKTLPHQVALEDARASSEWDRHVAVGQRAVLDRLAAAADPIFAAEGRKPKPIVSSRTGGQRRDYGADLDLVLSRLPAA